MKTYGYVVLAAIAAVLVSLGLSSSAQAYPDARIELTVNHQVLYSGDTFTATGTSSVACTLDLEWNDVVRHSAPTKRFATTYVAPQVTKVTKIPLTGVCQVADSSAGKSAASVSTLRNKLTVTVLPKASGASAAPSDNSADLPGTGGPPRVWLLGGLVLVLAGATAVTVARRRAEEVELPGQTA
jgi:hypothetical protein